MGQSFATTAPPNDPNSYLASSQPEYGDCVPTALSMLGANASCGSEVLARERVCLPVSPAGG